MLLLKEQVKSEVSREYLYQIHRWPDDRSDLLRQFTSSSWPALLKTGMPHVPGGNRCGDSEEKSKQEQQGKGDLHGPQTSGFSCPSLNSARPSRRLWNLMSCHAQSRPSSWTNLPHGNSKDLQVCACGCVYVYAYMLTECHGVRVHGELCQGAFNTQHGGKNIFFLWAHQNQITERQKKLSFLPIRIHSSLF